MKPHAIGEKGRASWEQQNATRASGVQECCGLAEGDRYEKRAHQNWLGELLNVAGSIKIHLHSLMNKLLEPTLDN